MAVSRWSTRSRLAMLAAPLAAVFPSAGDLTAESDSAADFAPLRPLDLSFCQSEVAELTGNEIARLNGVVLEASIADLSSLMESGDLTSYALTRYYLHRIQRYDRGQLNAVMEINPLALDVAASRDADRAAGHIAGRLHGIPVLLKDNIGTAPYLHTTVGAAALQMSASGRDAFLVNLLIEAGAVILGKTNLTEWANWMHYTPANGFSAVGGQVVSPYLDWLDPSGSSTGSAVAITAGFAPLAIGTETVGSIISPSGRSGVVGFKPSLGLISRDMVVPITEEIDSPGPMALTVADVALAMNVLAGSGDLGDARSADASSLIGADFTSGLNVEQLQGKRVGIVAIDPALTEADQIALYALDDDIAALTMAGAEVFFVYPDEFPAQDLDTLFASCMRLGVDAYLAMIDAEFASLAEITDFNRKHPEVVPYGQERLLDSVRSTLTGEETEALGEEIRQASRSWLDELFATSGADLLLSIDDLFSLQYCMAGCPAINVPRGVTSDGVPTGLTFIGPYLSDVQLLGAAYAFEQTARRRVPPPLVASILDA